MRLQAASLIALPLVAASPISTESTSGDRYVFVDGTYEATALELADGPFVRTDRVSIHDITMRVTIAENAAVVEIASTTEVTTTIPAGTETLDGGKTTETGTCRETFLALQTGVDPNIFDGLISITELKTERTSMIAEDGCSAIFVRQFRIDNPPDANDGQVFPTTLEIVPLGSNDAAAAWSEQWTFIFDDMTAPAGEAPAAEHGITERDGNFYINSAPGKVLRLSRRDLPPAIAHLLVTTGAMITAVGPPDMLSTGDTSVLIEGFPVGREGDRTRWGGVVAEGSRTIFINGVPAAVFGETFATNPRVNGKVVSVGGIFVTLGDQPVTLTAFCDSGESTEAEMWHKINKCYELLPNSAPTQLLQSPVAAGDNELDLEPDSFEVGVEVLIGNDPETAERATVAAKGSIILDRNLQHAHPAGTSVVQVSGLAELLGPAAVAASDDTGTSSTVIIFGALALAAVVGGAFAIRAKRTHAEVPK